MTPRGENTSPQPTPRDSNGLDLSNGKRIGFFGVGLCYDVINQRATFEGWERGGGVAALRAPGPLSPYFILTSDCLCITRADC